MKDSSLLEPSTDNPVENLPPAQLDSRVENEGETLLPESKPNLLACLEALMFIAPGPVTPAQLATALDLPTIEVERGLNELEELYKHNGLRCGLRLQCFGGRLQMTTAPDTALVVERFLGLEVSAHLSRASVETLAIVMYKQPVTRPQIDAIRGVNSEAVLKSLLFKGLVQEISRAETPGRPILYGVTPECLQYFGLSSLEELPPLDLEESE